MVDKRKIDDSDLRRRYVNYNLDADPSGAIGHALVDEAIRAAGGIDNLGRWLNRGHDSATIGLEREVNEEDSGQEDRTKSTKLQKYRAFLGYTSGISDNVFMHTDAKLSALQVLGYASLKGVGSFGDLDLTDARHKAAIGGAYLSAKKAAQKYLDSHN